MKRLIIDGFIGFQPANDVTSKQETIELSTVGGVKSESAIVSEMLSRGLVTTDMKLIPFESEEYADAFKRYSEAVSKNEYIQAKNKAADELTKLNEERDFVAELKNAEAGFVNLNKTDNNDNKGDGKWYSLRSNKKQHKGDTAMTRGEAIAANIEIG